MQFWLITKCLSCCNKSWVNDFEPPEKPQWSPSRFMVCSLYLAFWVHLCRENMGFRYQKLLILLHGLLRLWHDCQTLTPIPRPVGPNLGCFDLCQWFFHWCSSEQPHKASWGLPRGKGENILLALCELLPACVRCSAGYSDGLPAPMKVRIGLWAYSSHNPKMR